MLFRSGNGNLFLLDATGRIILTTQNAERLQEFDNINFMDFLSNIDVNNLDKKISIIDDLKNDVANNVVYFSDNGRYYFQYMPIDFNDWSLFFIINYDILYAQIDDIIGNSLILSYIITIIMVLLGLAIFYLQGRRIEELNKIAFTDKLTKLANRDSFIKDIDYINKRNDKRYACVIIDVNDLKSINDSFGTELGDQALLIVAKSIRQVFKHKIDYDYSVARIYGDLFGIYLPYETSDKVIEELLKFTTSNTTHDELLEGIKIDYSIGLYVRQSSDDAQTIVEKALLTKDIAKKDNLNQILEYNPSFSESLQKNAMVRNNAEQALLNKDFKMFLQPKVDTKTGLLCGAEALTRWQIDDGYLSPALFIYELEKSRIIIELDFYILEQACQYLNELKAKQKQLIPISINFSRHHLSVDGFVDKLNKVCDKYAIASKYIVIEFTESIMIENHIKMREIIDVLRRNGYITSMDDFGSGYSSFGLLDDVLFDEIKLDRCLISNLKNDNRAVAIVRNVINMAKELG